MTVYAAVDIEKGSPVRFNYVKPLDPRPLRRSALREFKFFDCDCQRCKSDDDLGTFTSAFKCQDCQGPILPDITAENEEDETWKCGCKNCEKSTKMARDFQLSEKDLRQKFSMLKQSLSKQGLDSLIAKGLGFLDHRHGLIREMKQESLKFQIQPPNHMMGGPPLQDPAIYKDAKAKVKLLEELLYAYDRLEPGLSLTRGLLLYEYQSKRVQIANQDFEEANQNFGENLANPEGLLKELETCQELLMESIASLKLEPANSAMARHAKTTAAEELKQLGDYVEMIREICE